MAEKTPQNLVLSTEDLQAIIVGVASSKRLVTGIVNHLRPQLELLNSQLATQENTHHQTPQQQTSQTNRPEQEELASNSQGTQPPGQGNSQSCKLPFPTPQDPDQDKTPGPLKVRKTHYSNTKITGHQYHTPGLLSSLYTRVKYICLFVLYPDLHFCPKLSNPSSFLFLAFTPSPKPGK